LHCDTMLGYSPTSLLLVKTLGQSSCCCFSREVTLSSLSFNSGPGGLSGSLNECVVCTATYLLRHVGVFISTSILYYTILGYTILYSTLLYSTLLYSTLLYFILLYCTGLYCTVLYCIVLYCTVLYCTVRCSVVLCCTVLYCTMLYYIILYYTILYYIISYHIISFEGVCVTTVILAPGVCGRWGLRSRFLAPLPPLP